MLSRTTQAGGIAAALMMWGVVAAHEADAAIISMSYSFQLNNFQNADGPSLSPIASVSGSFRLNIDSAVPDDYDPLVIKLNSSTPRSALGSGLGFSSLSRGPVVIDGSSDDDLGTNNFVMMIDLSNVSAPRFLTCDDIHGGMCRSLPGSTLAEGYTNPSDPTALFLATTGTISATTETGSTTTETNFTTIPTISTVPLPASLPMAGTALLALAAVGYGMKRKSKPI